jgi:endonuclease-3
MKNSFYQYLDYYIPNPKCELDYLKDYELLIATVLSAQCTDKRVNMVTKKLFAIYDINSLANANILDIQDIIRPCGSFYKKSEYIIKIAQSLVQNYQGVVPNDRDYLESLPGVGRKTCNVVLKNLYNVPCIPVDTHVIRVSKRLGLAENDDEPWKIEQKLMDKIPKDKWNKVGEQILLFGRYYCKSVNPSCSNCLFKKDCKRENFK